MQIQAKGDQNKKTPLPLFRYTGTQFSPELSLLNLECGALPSALAHVRKWRRHFSRGRADIHQAIRKWLSTRRFKSVLAFLFPKVPPASCIPHTVLMCVLCQSPVLTRRKPSTSHTCASLPALDLNHTDLSFYPGRSLSLTTRATDLLSYAVVRSPCKRPPLLCTPSLFRSLSPTSGPWPACP